jgi:predicted LPLAT superfamily acyltransferase
MYKSTFVRPMSNAIEIARFHLTLPRPELAAVDKVLKKLRATDPRATHQDAIRHMLKRAKATKTRISRRTGKKG